ncbi:hypothetical protein LPJ64_003166 [Coemansia asiatica]|uniref:BZIP domain-containing protein n=1 Tax=Coemansia asiatica TaxID=1052880 RepID=A0A9W7XLJ9_9FUNG|nr:hypothetical protein LPJ64_003166 [Coemansia asiatica]
MSEAPSLAAAAETTQSAPAISTALSAATAETSTLSAASAPMAPPDFTSHLSTSTIDTHLLSPFPELPTDRDSTLISADDVTSAFTAATAAAISSAMASAQLSEDALTVDVGQPSHGMLGALHRETQEHVIEIMNSYQQTNAHRRRSSVEAAAAASSVLASIANSSKPFAGDATDGPQHSAAVALLAASGMHGVMLPTIPSESVSLRNTPGPTDSFDMQFGTLQNIQTRQQQPEAPAIDDDDEESLSDDSKPIAVTNGMPLTPDAPGSGRPGSLRHLTPDERRARRLQRNRLAAKECRQKKKAYISNLESQVADLQTENTQLRKEIEELNAKLTLSAMRSNNSTAASPTLDSSRPPESAASDTVAASSPSSASAALATAKRARIAEGNY